MHSIMWQAALHIQGNPQLEKQQTCNQKMQKHATTKYKCKKKTNITAKNMQANMQKMPCSRSCICFRRKGVRSELQTFKKLPKPKENAKKRNKTRETCETKAKQMQQKKPEVAFLLAFFQFFAFSWAKAFVVALSGCISLAVFCLGVGGGCFYFWVYSMVESIYLLCLAVSRLKGVLVTWPDSAWVKRQG